MQSIPRGKLKAIATASASLSLHVGIIMDGNGRWALLRGLPRACGHRAGVEALRRAIKAAPTLGVSTLTVYAFSADNWKRPPAEVGLLMGLLSAYLDSETSELVESGVRLTVIGRRDRLAPAIVKAIARAELATAGGRRLHLRIAVDYSARDAIIAAVTAAARCPDFPGLTRESFGRLLSGDDTPDVDLVIRTSGEQRLSDFMLWECAYAELLFTDGLWPDFDADEFRRALAMYHARDRRYGALTPVSQTPELERHA